MGTGDGDGRGDGVRRRPAVPCARIGNYVRRAVLLPRTSLGLEAGGWGPHSHHILMWLRLRLWLPDHGTTATPATESHRSVLGGMGNGWRLQLGTTILRSVLLCPLSCRQVRGAAAVQRHRLVAVQQARMRLGVAGLGYRVPPGCGVLLLLQSACWMCERVISLQSHVGGGAQVWSGKKAGRRGEVLLMGGRVVQVRRGSGDTGWGRCQWRHNVVQLAGDVLLHGDDLHPLEALRGEALPELLN